MCYLGAVPATKNKRDNRPLVGVIMGSESDWDTMRSAAQVLCDFGVPHEVVVLSAHRTPDEVFDYAKGAAGRGLEAIIAGAGCAAQLPGVISGLTQLPVLGVPILAKALGGLDSLLSIVQMPAGVPTATFAIGSAGATNAALFAMRMFALTRPEIAQRLEQRRVAGAQKVLASSRRVAREAARLERAANPSVTPGAARARRSRG